MEDISDEADLRKSNVKTMKAVGSKQYAVNSEVEISESEIRSQKEIIIVPSKQCIRL